MTSVATYIAELQNALATSTREEELEDLIQTRLAALRAAYTSRKQDFNADDIAFLKGLGEFESALRDFADCLVDVSAVRTRDDAAEMAGRFQELVERFQPHLMAKRAEKEVRELVEKSKSLPFSAEASADADFARRVTQLERTGRKCPKCGSGMAARVSQNGVWWGCSTFPRCFGRGWLSREERGRLYGTK